MPGTSLESELSKPPKRKARFTIFSAMTWNDRHRFARKGRQCGGVEGLAEGARADAGGVGVRGHGLTGIR